MKSRIFNCGPKGSRVRHTDLRARLRANVSRARRGSAFVNGALLLFIVLAVVAVYAQHDPALSLSFSQFDSGFMTHIVHFPQWVEGLYQTNANQLSNIGQ